MPVAALPHREIADRSGRASESPHTAHWSHALAWAITAAKHASLSTGRMMRARARSLPRWNTQAGQEHASRPRIGEVFEELRARRLVELGTAQLGLRTTSQSSKWEGAPRHAFRRACLACSSRPLCTRLRTHRGCVLSGCKEQWGQRGLNSIKFEAKRTVFWSARH